MALSTSLISYWSLADVNDAHGSNTLTNNATVTFTTGKVGNAASFASASNQYLSIVSNASLQTGDIDFTIAAWVNMTTKVTTMGIASKTNSNAPAGIEYDLFYTSATDRFRFRVSTGTASVTVDDSTLGAPATGTWYFIVAWHDSVNNQIGISTNAGTAVTAAHSTGVQSAALPFEIGRDAGDTTRDFNGLIDEVALWKRVLSGAERTELYNSGNGRDYAYVAGGAGTNYPQTVAGTLTTAGALSREAGKPVAGTLTSAGTLARNAGKVLSGTLTSAGTLLRDTGKVLAGTVTSAGVLVASLTFLRSVGGTLGLAGALVRDTGKTVSGAITPTGALNRAITKAFAGALSFIGSLIAAIVGEETRLLDVEVTDSAVYTATLTDSAVYTVTLSDATRS